jgi:Na+/H+ antiporter NhaB
MLEYLIVLGLVIWAAGELLAGILLVTVLIAALAAAIKRK